MPQMTDFYVLELPAQCTLFRSAQVAVSELPSLIGSTYGEIEGMIAKSGAGFAGMPYVAFHNMDMDNLKVEIGIPVSAKIDGAGEIASGKISAGKFAGCIYMGPYTGMESTYEALTGWIAGLGLKPTGVVYEHYLNGPPEYLEEHYLTEIRFAVE